MPDQLIDRIRSEFESTHEDASSRSAVRNRVAQTMYRELPNDDGELIELFDAMVQTGEWRLFWLATLWIKRRELYGIEYMEYYERWLYEHVDDWGVCDVFCYRVLNPMVERYPQLYEHVLKWAESPKTYVRRAAPVSLLESGQSFSVNYDFDRVIGVVEKLKHDNQDHVQKGIGWLLKYAYLAYPREVYTYLRDNVNNLPRVIFRYAVEKTPPEIRKELMSL